MIFETDHWDIIRDFFNWVAESAAIMVVLSGLMAITWLGYERKRRGSFTKRKAEKEKKLAEKRAEHEELAQKLSSLEVSIPVDAGESGKLFGSVTSQDIAAAVQAAAQIDIDKKKIELAEPIKVVGQYSVPVKLFQDVSATLKVKIEARKSG